VDNTLMKKIMNIGNATLDIIIAMDAYPIEDKKHLALGQRFQRGGNAANTSDVLAQLGCDVSLLVPLADDDASNTICHSLESQGVNLSHCIHHKGSTSPTSYILTNEQSKTRTIIHCRDLPEFLAEDFADISLENYNLLHFEGRNIAVLKEMLLRARTAAPNAILSLEIEKPRKNIEFLIQLADLIVFSNSYYQYTQSNTIADFFQTMRQYSNTATFVCSRGSEGAYGSEAEQAYVHSPAFNFGDVVDTVGAGDTFNAGLLASFCEPSLTLQECLHNACLLASKKVTQKGFAELTSFDLTPLGVR